MKTRKENISRVGYLLIIRCHRRVKKIGFTKKVVFGSYKFIGDFQVCYFSSREG